MKMSELVSFLDDSSEFEIRYHGSKVRYLDEVGRITNDSKFFVAGFEFGPTALIHVESYRGDGFETAWGVWKESLPTIEENELIEAYSAGRDKGSFLDEAVDECRGVNDGPWGDEVWAQIRANARAAMHAAAKAADDGLGDYPELVEGYEWTESGAIVDMGHYAQMHEAELNEVEIVRKEASALAAE